jgi:hypothetical protein
MGLIFIILGVLLWLLLGWQLVGIILIVLGLVLFFIPGAPYGYHSRGAP